MTTKYILSFDADDNEGEQLKGMDATNRKSAHKEAKNIIDWPSFEAYTINYGIYDASEFMQDADGDWTRKEGKTPSLLAVGTAHIRASEEMS